MSKSNLQDSTDVPKSTIYQFSIKGIDGKDINFSDFKGKKILVVNVASKCGFTPQYKSLESLYQTYKNQLVVIGFPCNQFFAQEPGTDAEIASFCKSKYDVTFPLTTKIDVKGKNITPIYQWLCHKKENGVLSASITWNFNKFLIDENGYLVAYFGSSVNPESQEILQYFKK